MSEHNPRTTTNNTAKNGSTVGIQADQVQNSTVGDEYRITNTGPTQFVLKVGNWSGQLCWHPPAQHSADDSLLEPLRRLAREAEVSSRDALEAWEINKTDALSVRWSPVTDEDLVDYPESIHGSAEPLSLEGHFTAIRDTYRAVHSKRLVILGQGGAGKTVLAHRLILDLLAAKGTTGPVPVLFSLGDWNPETDLRRWLAERLERDFVFLNKKPSSAGKTEAGLLVEAELVIPILDGFDELLESRRFDAISAINKVDFPLVVTSRPEQYGRAVRRARAVGRAAAIELRDVDPAEACRYLRLSANKSRGREWDAVFANLDAQPCDPANQNLARVLSTPLMVTLARIACDGKRDHRPRDLLDNERFPNTDALKDHLWSTYLDAAYEHLNTGSRPKRRPEWDSDQARRWLASLAKNLNRRDTHDLGWWQLPASLHRRTRILLVTVAVGLLLGPGYWVAVGAEDGVLNGLGYGIVLAILNERAYSRGGAGFEPERVRPSFGRRRRKRVRVRYLRRSAAMFGSAFLLGFWVAFQSLIFDFFDAAYNGDHLLASVLGPFIATIAVLSGFVTGLVNVIVLQLGEDYPVAEGDSAWRLLKSDRATTIVKSVATLIAFQVVWFVILGISPVGTAGLGDLLAEWIVAGFVYLINSAWGNWVLFVRLWLPLTRRLPWRPKLFIEDAYDRGVLRKTGAIYQFRHAELRDHLVKNTELDSIVDASTVM